MYYMCIAMTKQIVLTLFAGLPGQLTTLIKLIYHLMIFPSQSDFKIYKIQDVICFDFCICCQNIKKRYAVIV